MTYTVGNGEAKTVKLVNDRTATIAISVEELVKNGTTLQVTGRYRNQVQHVSLQIPYQKHTSSPVRVKFYPEGGYLEGLTSRMGWEVNTGAVSFRSFKGILYKDEEPVDTLMTNSQGIGSFLFTPEAGSRYAMEVSGDALSQEWIYALPVALKDGIALHLPQAVASDTLRFRVQSSRPRQLWVLVHDYKNGYASFPVTTHSRGTSHTLALPVLPRGLATLTILDESGRPVAERLFFARYDKKAVVGWIHNKKSYGKREEVSLKLRLSDQENKPLKGVMSVAVVQEGRLDPLKQHDIESYASLESELGRLPVDAVGRGIENRDYLEGIMLVKGWRRYSWQALEEAEVGDTLIDVQRLRMTGRALRDGKALKKPVPVTLMRGLESIHLYETDEEGYFTPSEDDLLVLPGERLLASVELKNKADYTIESVDPFVKTTERAALQTDDAPAEQQAVNTPVTSRDHQLKGMEHTVQLSEVVIRPGRRGGALYGKRKGVSNECGDYVLSGNLFYPHECRLYQLYKDSPYRELPEVGKRYTDGIKIQDVHDGSIGYHGDGINRKYRLMYVVYQGCVEDQGKSTFKLNGIYMDKEFYGFDTGRGDSLEPQFLSTLYWKPGLLVNEDGEADISFYTGDITGAFKIVVQGVGGEDVLYGEEAFVVR